MYIILGLGMFVVADLLFPIAGSFLQVFALRALQGLGIALTVPCTLALLSDASSSDTRGGYMGLYNTFRLAGFGVGPLIAGVIIHFGPGAVVVRMRMAEIDRLT